MHITDVVDEHTKGEGAGIGLSWELLSDSLDVGRVLTVDLAFHVGSHVGHGLDNVDVRHGEVEVIESGALLVQVGEVDEVPVALEGVTLTLDGVGKSGALCEGVVVLSSSQVGFASLKVLKLSEGGTVDVWAVRFEDSLSSSGDYGKKMGQSLLVDMELMYLLSMWAVPQKASAWAAKAARVIARVVD